MKYIALVLMVLGLGVAVAADYTPNSSESAQTISGALTASGVVVMSNAAISMSALPTATTGLASGRIWANSNVLTVIP